MSRVSSPVFSRLFYFNRYYNKNTWKKRRLYFKRKRGYMEDKTKVVKYKNVTIVNVATGLWIEKDGKLRIHVSLSCDYLPNRQLLDMARKCYKRFNEEDKQK